MSPVTEAGVAMRQMQAPQKRLLEKQQRVTNCAALGGPSKRWKLMQEEAQRRRRDPRKAVSGFGQIPHWKQVLRE